MIIKYSGQVEVGDEILDRVFGPVPEQVVLEQTPPEPESKPVEKKPAKKGRTPTEAALKKKAAKLVEAGRVDDLKTIMETFGIKRVPDLDKAKWVDFEAALDEALAA